MSSKSIAASFLSRLQNQITTRKQYLDANQLLKLSATLNSPITVDPKGDFSAARAISGDEILSDGTPVPPGWHLAYFTPTLTEDQLGLDGSDKSFNPDPPFTRRMWAGGRLSWHNPTTSAGLRIGDVVTERTSVIKADPKVTRAGDEMIVAGAKKEYLTPSGEKVLTDQREWVFRKELDPQKGAAVSTAPAPPKKYETASTIVATSKHCQTPISLFRFSAVTFNAHQIHYSREWCRSVEGHRDIVVHAPLNLVLMLELYRKAYNGQRSPASMEYRALSPLYAGDEYTIKLAESGEIWVERDQDGGVCVQGKVE